MQKIFFRLIFRRMKSNKLYTFINILGLSISLTASLLIYSHVVKEFKTDRFHENGENIYRANLSGIFNSTWSAVTCDGLGPALKNDIPGVKHYTRIFREKFQIKSAEATDFIQTEHCIYTDNDFFRMFSFPLITGNIPEETKENWCVISEKYAKLCFGEEDPTGEMLVLKPDVNFKQGEEVRIVGIMKNIPDWSSIQADIVLNYKTKAAVHYPWNDYNVETFVELAPHTDSQSVSASIHDLFKKHASMDSEQIQGYLQPLYDIYFGSAEIEFGSSMGNIPHGSRLLTIILVLVTIIIFILTACNYMLIKIANLNQEFAQLAIQKCYGAATRSLQLQLIAEMVLQILTAFILSGIAVKIIHPYFISIISPKQPYALCLTVPEMGFYMFCIIILTGIIVLTLFLYTQKHLASYSIKEITLKQTGRYDMKKILTILQMCIFCTLFFVSAIVLKQMHYLANKDLGINTENTMWFRSYCSDPSSLKNDISQNPKIISISNSSPIPSEKNFQVNFILPDEPEKLAKCNVLIGDCEFLSTFKIPLSEGKNIDPESFKKNDEIQNSYYQNKNAAKQVGKEFTQEFPYFEHQILVNRKFVKMYRLQQPVGSVLTIKKGNFTQYFRIVGVTEDFNYQPLYKNIEPVIICYNAGFNSGSFNLRYQKDCRQDVITFLTSINEQQKYHSSSLIYSEYSYSDIYDKDIAFIRMINIFTLLALLIGGMGIFAFSVFLAENKKKEVAIRKVNGATEWEVVTFLNSNFIKRTLIACAISLPTGYFFMQKWLENFAYKTTLDWWLYLGVIFICTGFVVFIVSFQTWKSASLNPVKSLKRE